MEQSLIEEIGELIAKHKLMKPYSVLRSRVPTKSNPKRKESYRITPLYRINLYEKSDHEECRNAANAMKLFTHKEHDVYYLDNPKSFSDLTDIDKKALTGTHYIFFAVYDSKRPLLKDYISHIAVSKLPVVV